ncbi:MAG: glycosyltransferase family protein [Chloroflexota bacterium]
MPKTLAIIQARMGASRLPGKVLLDLGGEPMLVRVVERTKRASLLDAVTVATTTEVQDAAIAELCASRGYSCYRGSMHDVLDRYYQAARPFDPEIIVRITADCPVIDPDLIDQTIQTMGVHDADFTATRLPPPWHRTYPIGLDVEVCAFTVLQRAWKEADQGFHREHVLPFLYEGVELKAVTTDLSLGTSQRGFKIAVLNHDPDYGSMRWAVDTPEDLEVIRQVYHRFNGRDDFSWQEILALFANDPCLAKINASIPHKTMFDVDKKSH